MGQAKEDRGTLLSLVDLYDNVLLFFWFDPFLILRAEIGGKFSFSFWGIFYKESCTEIPEIT